MCCASYACRWFDERGQAQDGGCVWQGRGADEHLQVSERVPHVTPRVLGCVPYCPPTRGATYPVPPDRSPPPALPPPLRRGAVPAPADLGPLYERLAEMVVVRK